MAAANSTPIRPAVTRVVRLGGVNKEDLLSKLQVAGVRLNEAALALFADDRFTTTAVSSFKEVVELSLDSLGLHNGATFTQIIERAAGLGLAYCPLELGPHLRLQFMDQPEGLQGQPFSQHRAPPGSVTVACAPLTDEDDTPKGFYLRRIEGVLWLRGYRSSPEHNWSPEDRFVFCRAS